MELRSIADNEFMEIEEMETLLGAKTFTDVDADRLIRIFKAIDADRAKFKDLATRQIEDIKARAAAKEEKYHKELESIALQLKTFAETQKTKDTKTQRKYQSLSGDVIIKKGAADIKADTAALLQAIEGYPVFTDTDYTEFIKVETVKKLDWRGLKARLSITDTGAIFDRETGEVLELEGVSIETKPESVEIK